MSKFFSKLSNVNKFLASLVGVALMAAAPFVPGVTEQAAFGIPVDSLTQMVLGVLTVAGVYKIPNTPTDGTDGTSGTSEE